MVTLMVTVLMITVIVIVVVVVIGGMILEIIGKDEVIGIYRFSSWFGASTEHNGSFPVSMNGMRIWNICVLVERNTVIMADVVGDGDGDGKLRETVNVIVIVVVHQRVSSVDFLGERLFDEIREFGSAHSLELHDSTQNVLGLLHALSRHDDLTANDAEFEGSFLETEASRVVHHVVVLIDADL